MKFLAKKGIVSLYLKINIDRFFVATVLQEKTNKISKKLLIRKSTSDICPYLKYSTDMHRRNKLLISSLPQD